jgi:O-antigen/teichoic acid export membrane protein
LIGTVSQFFSVTLIASMKLRPLLVQNIIATVFNVALNVALIPVFGALACAWLTVGTEAIVCVGSAFTLFSTMEFRFAAPEAIKATRVVVGATLLASVGLAVHLVVSMVVFAVALVVGLLWFESWPTEFLPNRLLRKGNS